MSLLLGSSSELESSNQSSWGRVSEASPMPTPQEPTVAPLHLIFRTSSESEPSLHSLHPYSGEGAGASGSGTRNPSRGAASGTRASVGAGRQAPCNEENEGSDSSEGEEDDQNPEEREHRRQEIIRGQLEAAGCTSMRGAIPLDDAGRLTSLGSANHATATCSPCPNIVSGTACPQGILCKRCHFPSHCQIQRKNKARPCKGKRDRYRKLVNRTMAMIANDPDNFNPEGIDVPPSIAANKTLMAKFLSRMRTHAERMRVEQLQGGNPAAAPAVAAQPPLPRQKTIMSL